MRRRDRSRRGTGWAALALSTSTACFLLGATSPEPAVPEDRVILRTETDRLVLPWVERDDLLPGSGAPIDGSQRSSISLDVTPPRTGSGWELTVRTAPVATAATRPPRVYWKLASESPSEYRPLGDEEQLVKRSANPTSEKITIDVVFGVDWNVDPGRYDVDFLFALEPL